MRIHRLTTVDGFIAFDLDDAPYSAGGTRLAPDVTEVEVGLLARAMTYKFAAVGAVIGGAKAGVRGDPADPGRDELMDRYCHEVLPLVRAGEFGTGPDMGTSEFDFSLLRADNHVPSAVTSLVDGVPFEDVLTGFGVAVAAETALGGLDGRKVAIEGFGKVGGGVAKEVARRGARVVAVSTLAGCVADPDGFVVDELFAARAEHGDRFVGKIGRPVLPADRLFDIEVDVLVPGARTGIVDAARAGRVTATVIAPAANMPYTAGGFDVLRQRGIAALPDFVCNVGAVIGYLSPTADTPAQVLARVEARIAELIAGAMAHPEGPFVGACAAAEEFLRTWREPEGMPEARPLA